MKLKITSLIILCLGLFSIQTFAQSITINPPKFTAEDEITITVDLTGDGDMEGLDAVYMWTWTNLAGGEAYSGTWGSSSDNVKLTQVSGNTWKITLVPATFYNATPAELKVMNFLFKSKTGTSQTKNFENIKLDPLTFSETQFRSFPSKAGQNDIVTVFMNNSLAETEEVQRMTVSGITLKAFDATDTQIGDTMTETVDSFTNGLASFGFIPTKLFTGLGGSKIVKIKYEFTGTGLDENGSDKDVTSNEGEVILLDLL